MAIKHEKLELNKKELFHRIYTLFERNNVQYALLEDTLENMPSKKHYVVKINAIDKSKNDNKFKKPSNTGENSITPIIIKLFNERILDFKSRFKAEIENYNLFEQLAIENIQLPKRLAFFSEMVIYEYINGKTCVDFLKENTMNESVWALLGTFLAQLHNKGMIFGDCRLNNYIIAKERLYIVDFEEIKKGEPVSDLANICSAFLDNYPGIFEEIYSENSFKALFKFLKVYNSNINTHSGSKKPSKGKRSNFQWTPIIMSGLMETAIRRGKKIGQNSWKKIEQIIIEMSAKYG